MFKKPKNVTLIDAFPGFGLVGTIAGEFLIEHLGVEQIGKVVMTEVPAMVAIHGSKVVEPFGIFYSKKYNIVLLHAIMASHGHEWELADIIMKLAKDLSAREIVSLEGVGSGDGSEGGRAFFFANEKKNASKFEKMGINVLKEGIIIGVSGALLLRTENVPISCIFAETASNLPDSKAAAKIIEVLDKYLGLDVDPKPLLEQAEKFEGKLRGILEQGAKAQELSEQKRMSYVG